MKELTLKSAVDLHREMWNWLVDNPGKWKDEWDRWEEIKDEFEEATKLAKTIANLPLKPEYQQQYENECEPKFYASSDWVNGIMKEEDKTNE